MDKDATMMGSFRKVTKLLKSRIGTIFVIVCLVSVGLYMSSFFHGSSDSSFSNEGAGRGRKLSNTGRNGHGHGRRRKHPHGDNEETFPQNCRVPKLKLEDDTISHYFYPMAPLHCPTGNLMYVKNGILKINETVLGNRAIKKCEYQAVNWVTDDVYAYSNIYTRNHEPYELKIKHDFFRVKCFAKRQNSKISQRKLLQDMNNEENVQDDAREANDQEKNNDEVHQQSKDVDSVKDNAGEIKDQEENNEHGNHRPRGLGSMGLPDPPVLSSQQKRMKSMIQKRETDLGDAGERDANADHNTLIKDQEELKQRNIKQEKEKLTHKEVESIQLGQGGDMEDSMLGDDKEMEDELMGDFDQFIAQIYPKEEVLERVKEIKPSEFSTKMNVLILALDSMSHMAFQRKLPKTYSYLKTEMKSVILNGYNIVGDGTVAALLPLLTGKNQDELPEARKSVPGSTFVDSYPLLWNKFEQKGYVTLFSEDRPDVNTFNLRLNGFENQPTDHYMRPFWLASMNSEILRKSPKYCLGGKPIHQYALDYIKQLFMHYRNIPKFAFGFFNLGHGDNNAVEYMDNDMIHLFEQLQQTRNLENTLVVVMSDHGGRFGKFRQTVQGKLEERLPMMSLAFPKWFQDKYPTDIANLRKNIDRLTTPFDIYETLKDLIDTRRLEETVHEEQRGISLLKEIPLHRTCATAGIDTHWCSCLQLKNADVKDKTVDRAVSEVIAHINEITHKSRKLCAELTVKKVLNASYIMPNEKLLAFVKNAGPDEAVPQFTDEAELDVIHYQITMETLPGNGVFEATVAYSRREDTFKVSKHLSRTNAYGNQPRCLQRRHPEMRQFCQCRKRTNHENL